MKIALLGYGRMGKEIEKIALERGHKIVLKIDIQNADELTARNLQKADVAIDFSIPESAFNNIMNCFKAGIPIVSGTTGWLNRYNEVSDYCKEHHNSFFYASNYSIGVNIFFEVNKALARMMNRYPSYEISLEEIHHIHKLDSPSGTAITIAEGILENLKRKKNWKLGENTDKDSLQITAKREGEVPGTHIVTYDSEVDYLEIKHVAKNRKGLALGAVIAAEFILGKTGIFSMNDLMNAE
jgi:4-hydroxy-tetrahydrodipicolinate reductase